MKTHLTPAQMSRLKEKQEDRRKARNKRKANDRKVRGK
jgi:hypothetical protein